MTPMELFTAGRLADAVTALRHDDITPSGERRLFLSDLLLVSGDIDQARRELDAVLPGDSDALRDFIEGYHLLLDAEAKRQRLTVDAVPTFVTEVPRHARLRLEAIQALRAGRPQSASERIDRANAVTPCIRGHVDGREFEALCDGDDRFASVLEVLTGGDYVWIPFEELRRVRLGKIESPRDQFFIPARVHLRDGSEWDVHLPALYVGSGVHPAEAIRCGRETDWFTPGSGIMGGVGLRVWTIGADEELTPWEVTQLNVRRS